jgi:hypothetical protein
MGFVFGEVDTELPAAAVPGDADANAAVPAVAGRGQLWNGTGWEREPANQEGLLLASAARTATLSSPDQINRGHRGVLIGLHVTEASGTGGIRLQILGLFSSYYALLGSSPLITTFHRGGYMVYPGASAPASTADQDLRQAWPVALPRTWGVYITHGDASSYTYSVNYALIR